MMEGIATFTNTSCHWYQRHTVQYAIDCAISVLLVILSIAGNGFVMYVASRNKNTITVKYLNQVVKSLAFTDFMFGFVGIPLSITYYYLSKYAKTVKFVNKKVVNLWKTILSRFHIITSQYFSRHIFCLYKFSRLDWRSRNIEIRLSKMAIGCNLGYPKYSHLIRLSSYNINSISKTDHISETVYLPANP